MSVQSDFSPSAVTLSLVHALAADLHQALKEYIDWQCQSSTAEVQCWQAFCAGGDVKGVVQGGPDDGVRSVLASSARLKDQIPCTYNSIRLKHIEHHGLLRWHLAELQPSRQAARDVLVEFTSCVNLAPCIQHTALPLQKPSLHAGAWHTRHQQQCLISKHIAPSPATLHALLLPTQMLHSPCMISALIMLWHAASSGRSTA